MLYVPPIGGAANDPYVDGNPGAATEGSAVPAAAIENPQREIVAVITGAGMAPNAGDLTQLRQAIAKMIQTGQRAVIIDAAIFAGAVAGTGKAVYWDSANNRFDQAAADGSVKQSAVGFADVPNAKVYCFGSAALFAGLTPGARYYLDVAGGGITSVMPSANAVFVGIAKSAAELFVDIDAASQNAEKQLQSVSASVAGNALTLGRAAGSLDFRNVALTNGTPNSRTFGALTLTVPSGATLGTVAGQSARLVLLALDVAGVVELAVGNLAGGVNLDETTLISTSAISGASNSASVIYSATARAGVPFRVVGFTDTAQAVPGTWASAPTLVQGAGGQALAALSSLGYGQTLQDVTGSRSVGTTYYNTTGRAIVAHVSGTQTTGAGAAAANFTINGVTLPGCMTYGNMGIFGANAVIPAGASYSVAIATLGGSYSGLSWKEMR